MSGILFQKSAFIVEFDVFSKAGGLLVGARIFVRLMGVHALPCGRQPFAITSFTVPRCDCVELT